MMVLAICPAVPLCRGVYICRLVAGVAMFFFLLNPVSVLSLNPYFFFLPTVL